MDECAANTYTCPINTYCNNTEGHYNCPCLSGLFFNGTGCQGKNIYFNYIIILLSLLHVFTHFFIKDINECDLLPSQGGCDLHVTCDNTFRNKTCGPCPVGYTGSGYSKCEGR